MAKAKHAAAKPKSPKHLPQPPLPQPRFGELGMEEP